jgi:hypothetical protein
MHIVSRCLDNALLHPVLQDMRRLDYIYASSLGFLTDAGVLGGCRRAEWYRMRGTPRDTQDTAKGLRCAKYGGACGDVEVELAKKARVYVGDEVAVIDDGHKISGRIDLIVLDPEAQSDPLIGIEIKSIQGWGAKGLTTPGTSGLFKPRDKDLAQAIFYVDFYKAHIPRWILRYIDRGTGDSHDHPLVVLEDGQISANNTLTGRSIHEVYAWTDSVRQHLDAGTEPPRDFSLIWSTEQLQAGAAAGVLNKTNTDKVKRGHKVIYGDWNCRYCRYIHLCTKDIQHPHGFTTRSALEHFKR